MQAGKLDDRRAHVDGALVFDGAFKNSEIIAAPEIQNDDVIGRTAIGVEQARK